MSHSTRDYALFCGPFMRVCLDIDHMPPAHVSQAILEARGALSSAANAWFVSIDTNMTAVPDNRVLIVREGGTLTPDPHGEMRFLVWEAGNKAYVYCAARTRGGTTGGLWEEFIQRNTSECDRDTLEGLVRPRWRLEGGALALIYQEGSWWMILREKDGLCLLPKTWPVSGQANPFDAEVGFQAARGLFWDQNDYFRPAPNTTHWCGAARVSNTPTLGQAVICLATVEVTWEGGAFSKQGDRDNRRIHPFTRGELTRLHDDTRTQASLAAICQLLLQYGHPRLTG